MQAQDLSQFNNHKDLLPTIAMTNAVLLSFAWLFLFSPIAIVVTGWSSSTTEKTS